MRDLVFFFKACKLTFFVAMASLKQMLFGLEEVLTLEKKRGRDGPTSHAKIHNHKIVNK